MARKTVTALEDDLTGGPADETVRFSLDGIDYEIDLSARNAERLRNEFDAFVAAGRRLRTPELNGVRPGSGGATPRIDRAQLTAIREWARRQGLRVSPRGRIPTDVMDAYNRQGR
jgi:hypothetical protein